MACGVRGGLAFGYLLFAVTACTGGGVEAPVAPAPQPAACVIVSAGPREPMSPANDTVVVGVAAGADPAHAPIPRNASERLVFAQVYETLLVRHCDGRISGGLADTWQRAPDGAWLLTLRDNARFSDGSPVAAVDVVTSWLLLTEREPTGGDAHVRAVLGEMVIAGERSLRVELTDPSVDGALLFSHAALAVGKRVPGSLWPLGSGPYVPVDASSATPSRGGSLLVLTPRPGLGAPPTTAAPDAQTTWWKNRLRVIAFRALPSGDPRNAIDTGVDVITTTDAVTIDYAAAQPSLIAAPLPWDRTYVLSVSRSPASLPDSGRGEVPDAIRGALAAEAVPAPARPAEPPYWWTVVAGACGEAGVPPSAGSRAFTGRIAYPADDAAARGLAERLVAVASAAEGDWLRELVDAPASLRFIAAPIPAGAFASALLDGSEPVVIAPVPRNALPSCAAGVAVVRGRLVVPLVDTRATAIVRRGAGDIAVDAWGMMRFAPVNAPSGRGGR